MYARTSRVNATIILLIVVSTCVLFSSVRDFELIHLDDPAYIHGSPMLREGLTLESVQWALTEYRPVYWHPLTWVSYLADVEIFGFGPRGHHITNLLLHALTAGAVFVLLLLVTGRRWPSAIVAAIFAVHPLHVESFAWVAERKDVLSGFFFITSLIAYVKHREVDSVWRGRPAAASWAGGPNRVWLVVSWILFVLACASKPMAVTLPCVLLLLDFWPLSRFSFRDKLPFFAVSVATAAITLWATIRLASVHAGDIIPPGVRIANAIVSYTSYISKTLWPVDLAVFYPYRYDIAASAVVFSCVLLIAITAAAIWLRRTQPHLLFGWLWFLGTLFPVIGIVQAGNQAMADRFMYIPLLGLVIAIVFTAASVATRLSSSSLATPAIAIAVVVALSIVSLQQLSLWRNSVTLFTHTLAITDQNSLVHTCLGLAYSEGGHRGAARDQFQKAIVTGIREITVNGLRKKFYGDWIADAYAGLGRLERNAGQHSRAAGLFEMAARIRPLSDAFHDAVVEGHLSAGDLQASSAYAVRQRRVSAEMLDRIGTSFLLRGDESAALAHFAEALDRSPRAAGTRVKYAVVLAHSGHMPAALNEMERALRDNPRLVEAHVEIALLLDRAGKPADARARLKYSLAIDPQTTRRYFASRTGSPMPAL